MTKQIYPEEIPFQFMGFDWKLRFIDISNECFGDTDIDLKEVRIYFKDRSHQNIVETCIHELCHVLLLDSAEPIFNYDHDKIDNKEENAVRILSPRLFHLIRNNMGLIEFILDQIKLMDGKKKKRK